MYFIHAIPQKALMKQYTRLFLHMLLLLLPVILIILYFSFSAARQLYSPISQILKQLNSRAGNNEIDMIRRSINQMTERLHKLVPVERNQLLRKAIHMGLNDEELKQITLNIGRIYPQLPCHLVYICAENDKDEEQDLHNLLHLKILNILKTEYDQDRNMISLPYKPRKTYLFISGNSSLDTSGLKEKLKDLQDRIFKETGFHVSIAISESIKTPGDIYHAGRVVRELIQYRGIYGSAHILDQEITASHTDKDYKFPEELNGKIVESVKMNKRELYERFLDDFLDGITHREIDTFTFAVTQLHLNIIMTMSKILRQNRTSTDQIFSAPHRPQDFHGLSALRQYFIKIFDDFSLKLLDQKKTKPGRGQKIVSEAMDIVEKQYMNPLMDLSFIAERLQLSANYLSRIYKEETGQNLTAFIRQCRMEEAKVLLLKEKDLTVQEIASMCGYQDMNYFSYSFRQFFGTPPSTFRGL